MAPFGSPTPALPHHHRMTAKVLFLRQSCLVGGREQSGLQRHGKPKSGPRRKEVPLNPSPSLHESVNIQ